MDQEEKKVYTKQNLTKHGFFGPWANKPLHPPLFFLTF
jgi:hypothetical protein